MPVEIVLAGAARTAVGNFNGVFAETPAPLLGAAVVRAVLQRAGIGAGDVDEVIMGNVLSAGLGQNPARQAAIHGGLPASVGATTIAKVCGSGLKAVMLAAQAIQCGDGRVIVAGGMENMSRAPYLLDKARTGYRLGHGQLIDSLLSDGLTDAYANIHMGICGDRCAEKYALSREEQDAFAIESYQRARAGAAILAGEIVPLEVAAGKGTVTAREDEGPKRFDEAKLRKLRPAFSQEGTTTAGNASSLNDGAAGVAVLSAERARELGVKPAARILGYTSAAREPEWFTLAPIGAVGKLLEKLGMGVGDVDLFEINEAFAAVPLAAMRDLGIPREKMNVLGGAIALGHPIGASGARVLVTLLSALRHQGKRVGVASLCIGGGEAVAMAVELV